MLILTILWISISQHRLRIDQPEWVWWWQPGIRFIIINVTRFEQIINNVKTFPQHVAVFTMFHHVISVSFDQCLALLQGIVEVGANVRQIFWLCKITRPLVFTEEKSQNRIEVIWLHHIHNTTESHHRRLCPLGVTVAWAEKKKVDEIDLVSKFQPIWNGWRTF